MAKGEAMRKVDKRIEAIWNKIHNLDMQNKDLRDMRYVPEAINSISNKQNLLIAALVEAGILIEKEEESKQYLQFGDQKYTIRKVK
jgi:hypothetical protein